MSVKIFNEVAEQFLTRDECGVLAIKGDWGVGKTYAWQHLVARLSAKRKPSTYCYVSLFGMASIKDVRMAMLGGIASKSPGDTKRKSEVMRSRVGPILTAVISKGGTILDAFSDSRIGKGIGLTLDAVAPYFLKDMVVCFDDFERTGNQLSHDELMGFISTLKESAGCKVVLIMNEEKLGQTAYATYREKVVDQEIWLSPTSEEALQWGVPSDLPQRDFVARGARMLHIVNVRVLKKISGVVRLLARGFKDIRPEVQREAVSSAVVLGWTYFDRSGAAPTVEFVRGWNIFGMTTKAEKAKLTPEEERWRQALNDFGFMHFDELDAAVLKVVEQGYIQDSGFESEAAKRSGLYANGDLEESFRGAWTLFHESFHDNADEVASALDREARRAVRIVNPLDLDATVNVLRNLNRNDLADPLIEFYVRERQGDQNFWDLSSNPFGQVTDLRVDPASV